MLSQISAQVSPRERKPQKAEVQPNQVNRAGAEGYDISYNEEVVMVASFRRCKLLSHAKYFLFWYFVTRLVPSPLVTKHILEYQKPA